jgi:hypothetical protein
LVVAIGLAIVAFFAEAKAKIKQRLHRCSSRGGKAGGQSRHANKKASGVASRGGVFARSMPKKAGNAEALAQLAKPCG